MVYKRLVLSATIKAKTVFCNMLFCKCSCFAQVNEVNVHLFLQIYAALAITLSIDLKKQQHIDHFKGNLHLILYLKMSVKKTVTQTLRAKVYLPLGILGKQTLMYVCLQSTLNKNHECKAGILSLLQASRERSSEGN